MSTFPEEEDVSPIMKGGEAAKAAGMYVLILTIIFIHSFIILYYIITV